VEDLLYVFSRNERLSATIITNDFTFLKRIKAPELHIALMEEVKRIVSEKVSAFRETL
jgi:hypothetical protein